MPPQPDVKRAMQAIEIDLAMPEPSTHYLEVAIRVAIEDHATLDFIMPVWTPGSYFIREFARNVEGFTARSEAGEDLDWEKLSKNAWRVHSRGSAQVTVRYRVYAFELSVRTSYVDDSHAAVNGASVFMYLEGARDRSFRLRVRPCPGWCRISTGLEPVPGEPNTFAAPDYDTLVD